jgi:hypothetical protein
MSLRFCRDSSGLREGGEFRDRVSIIPEFDAAVVLIHISKQRLFVHELQSCGGAYETAAECRQLINGTMETEAYYNVLHQ